MPNNSIIEIAHKWFAAFNAHNLEQLLYIYNENAIHYSPKLKIRQPETNGFVTGKAELRQWWADSFSRLPSLKYIPLSFIADNNNIFMEYKRIVDGEPELMVGEVLEIKDGLIIKSRVYHG